MTEVKIDFRTIRIGTLKIFALPEADSLSFGSDTFKVKVKLPRGEEYIQLNIEFPTSQITSLRSYLAESCPVIWFKTDRKCMKYLQELTEMKRGPIPSFYYDPDSNAIEESYVAIVIKQSKIPREVVYMFRGVLDEVCKIRGIRVDELHASITDNQCNKMLFDVSNFYKEVDKFRKKCEATTNLDIEKEMPTVLKESASLLSKSVSNPSKESSCKKSDGSLTSKNTNRARKSIPKSNRTISLETQLNEIRAKAGLPVVSTSHASNAPATPTIQEDVSDNASDSNSSTSVTAVKKKKPKDPFLWKGRSKRKKKNSSDRLSVQSAVSSNSHSSQQTEELVHVEDKLGKLPDDESTEKNQKALDEFAGRYKATASCLCTERSPYFIKISGVDEIKCMCIDNVDGRLTSCINLVKSSVMMKVSHHSPNLALCEEHRERMRRHECCPGCGTFCAGGTYLVCVNTKDCPHRFHKDCMLLHRQTKDCLHCKAPMSLIREVNIDPRQDHKLRWVIAGQDPEKMEKKRSNANRERTARMGHTSILPSPMPMQGVVRNLRPSLTIDTSSLPEGQTKDFLEGVLCDSYQISNKKRRVSMKNMVNYIQIDDFAKVIVALCEAEECDIKSMFKSPTILNKAAGYGNLAAVYLFCLAGVNINQKDVFGKTAVFYAAEIERVDIIEYLISRGAEIKHEDNEGLTAFHYSCKNGRITSISALMRYCTDLINMPDKGGWTPITWAAEHGQIAATKYLEHFSADINKADVEGNICLHWAALSGSLDIVMMCLRKHCDMNHQNNHGDTALHIAARQDHTSCIVCLLCWGADPTIRNNDSSTAADCSAPNSTSYLLLQCHVKINKTISDRHIPTDSSRDRVICADISRGFENLLVSCVNSVDDSVCPTDPPEGFHYVTANVHTSKETIMTEPVTTSQFCQCFNRCMNDTCICCCLSEKCWYDEDGLLVPEFDMLEPSLVFECSKMCFCPPTCRNRVVQKGLQYNLQVHRTRGMGWSVRTLDTIPRGAFVCEYVGEVISDAEADIREDDSYLFDLENKDGEYFCIDARYYGNVSRFINHLCNPNLLPIRVYVDHRDIRFPRLAYFSTREIKAGEELGFDYGDRFWDVKCKQFTCGCGLPQCKYSKEAYRIKELKESEEKTKLEEEVGRQTIEKS